MHETDEPTAATEAELRAAEALADEARSEGARSITELHDTIDANEAIADHMTSAGLDVGDTPSWNRVAATADLLLATEVDRFDGDSNPMSCGHCHRPIAYDERLDDYRHLVAADRGCFLIPPRGPSVPPPRPRGSGLST